MLILSAIKIEFSHIGQVYTTTLIIGASFSDRQRGKSASPDQIKGQTGFFQDGRSAPFDAIVAGIGFERNDERMVEVHGRRLLDLRHSMDNQQYFGVNTADGACAHGGVKVSLICTIVYN